MAKKYASLNTLAAFLDNIKEIFATKTDMSEKANKTHSHTTADVTDLQSKLDNINLEIDGCITGLSVSGQTITYTKNDGTGGTITTQDENTDTNVTNTLATTTKAYVTGTTSNTTNTGTQVFDTGVYLDNVGGQLVATTFKGNLVGNADSATKAVQDASGNIINSTYETKADAIAKLNEAKKYAADGNTLALETAFEMSASYTDNAVSQKTQVQIITWGVDD